MAPSAVMTARKKQLNEAAQSLTPGERLRRALELSGCATPSGRVTGRLLPPRGKRTVISGFHQAIDVLESLWGAGGIDGYALVGGLAVSVWATPRATEDIDILGMEENGNH